MMMNAVETVRHSRSVIHVAIYSYLLQLPVDKINDGIPDVFVLAVSSLQVRWISNTGCVVCDHYVLHV